MAKKKKDRKVQKNLQVTDVSFAPPAYERTSLKSNTKDFTKRKSNKDKCTDSNLCQCHDSNHPKTWQSITNMYGDQDTTEIWNTKEQTPAMQFSPSRWKKNKENKNKYAKKSKGISYKHTDNMKKSPLHNDNVIKDGQPTIQLKLKKNKKSKKKELLPPADGTGDSCIGGPCRTDVANNKVAQKSGVKQVTKKKNEINKTNIIVNKKDHMEGQGDRTIPNAKEKLESKSYTYNFISKLKKLKSTHKVDNTIPNVPIKTEPMFEMKVDSEKMSVLNPREVQINVKKFGTLKNEQCICPSRLSPLKNVCNSGICERAYTQGTGRFKCKCGKKHVIECLDTTCDSKNNPLELKGNSLKSSKYDSQNNPLLEVMVDSNMKVLNSDEIRNILNDANNKICRSGICNVAAKKHMNLNCKCLNKKITPNVMECTQETCQPHKRCKIFYLCSRIFSKSENAVGNYRVRPQLRRREYNIKSDHVTGRINRNSYNTNFPRVPQHLAGAHYRNNEGEVDFCKCYCECDEETSREHKPPKSKKVESRKVKRKSKSHIRNMQHHYKQRYQRHQRSTARRNIMKFLRRRRKRCEQQIKEKEEEYNKHEIEQEKKYQKEKKIQEHLKKDEQNWNCLSKFVSGILNLLVKSIKNIFSAIFSIFLNPIGSYIYIRERVKDPPGSVKRLGQWIIRTWSNKTSKLSQTVKQSHAINVIADQIQSTAMYETLLADRGKTKEERAAFEKQRQLRKKRIQKRQDEALYGCRHMILTTLRKTPYLWFYHICPDMYPQCLGLVTFIKNFLHLIIFLIAFLCWTPCIVSFELCRAFLCCVLCTN